MSLAVRRPRKRCCSVLHRRDGRKRQRFAARITPEPSSAAAVKVVQEVHDDEVHRPTTKKSLEQHSMGVFSCLPLEILQFIFTFLDCNSLGILGLSSSELCAAIRSYVYTNTGLKQVLPRAPNSFSEQVNANQFGELGCLLKRITLLQKLRPRLKAASYILKQLEPIHTTVSEYAGTAVAYTCFGQLLFSYTSSWDDYEKTRVYCLVQSTARLEERVNKVLRSAPASLPWHEKDVRLLHRLVFLCPSKSDQEYSFWLTKILKPWPITFRARLLYLLTAPENPSGFVTWTQVCGCSSLQHTSGVVDFSELARALRILYSHRPRDWSEDDIISIIDELTTTPNCWCLENVAQLLLHCGSDITKGVLGCRAINGRVEELTVIAYYLAHACVSADKQLHSEVTNEHVQWFLSILRFILDMLPQSKDRKHLLSSLMETWQEYLTALFEDVDPENSDNDQLRREFHSTLQCLTNLSTTLLNIALVNISS